MRILGFAIVAGLMAITSPAVAQDAPLVPIAKPLKPLNPGRWVVNGDYPRAAHKAQGIVRFRLDVNRDGQVTACKIIDSSSSPVLDETTCSLMLLRARFEPAEDAKGNHLPATYFNRFVWSHP